MRIFTCDDHAYFYPVGVASVIVAENLDESRWILAAALRKRGLRFSDADVMTWTLTEVDTTEPHAIVLCDGNY